MKDIEPNSLIGEHILSGAFFDSVNEPAYEGCGYTVDKTVLRFTLDGQNYEAVEDPDDGYRSSMGSFRTCEMPPRNTFPDVRVIVKQKDKSESLYGGEDDIFQILNASTGKVIIEFGTSDTCDYYPGFVAEFHPHFAK